MTMGDSKNETDYSFLWEEYKLLQDKVDKIGGFRFQVKGWLIPLIAAWLAAIYSAHITPFAYLVAASFPWLFWLLEQNHIKHQGAFIRRIVAIEETLLRHASPPYFGPRPKVSKDDTKKLLRIPPISPRQAISLTNRELGKTRSGKLILAAHSIFYGAITFAVVLVTALSVGPVARFLNRFSSQPQGAQCTCAAGQSVTSGPATRTAAMTSTSASPPTTSTSAAPLASPIARDSASKPAIPELPQVHIALPTPTPTSKAPVPLTPPPSGAQIAPGPALNATGAPPPKTSSAPPAAKTRPARPGTSVPENSSPPHNRGQ
jgi:hypothetical protein